MTNIPRDHTGRPIRPTDLADLNDPTPPLSPTAMPTAHQQAAMDGTELPPATQPRKPAGPMGGFLAWIVILGVVGFLFASNNHLLDRFLPQQPVDPAAVIEEIPYPAPDFMLELQGRYFIGSNSLLSSVTSPEDEITAEFAKALDPFAKDDPVASLRVAMIAAELVDTEAAGTYLDNAEQLLDDAETPFAHDSQTREDIAFLRAHYANPAFDSLTDDERASFVTRHGWIAELTLTSGAPDTDPARASLLAQATKTSIVVLGAGITVIGAAVVGLVLAILGIVFLATGKLKPLYEQPTNGAGPFAEAFALFLLGFLGVSWLAEFIHKTTGNDYSLALIWLLPLAALWPLLRGVPTKQWKHALGWHTGKGVVREVFAGIVGYLAGLPIVAVGIGCTFLLTSIAGYVNNAMGLPDEQPTHPIAENIDTSNILAIVAIYITACVWAPFVEETLFRGALYNNTRRVLHPIFAALFTGFLFAAIHPQGWIAIPALMSLGVVFALLREWRGSLIAPAVAHAINNGFVFTILILALG